MIGDPDDEDAQLSIPEWNFGLIIESTQNFEKRSGLIGMAYPNFASDGFTPFFEALRQTGKLEKDVHSWYLSNNVDEQGEIMFGGWNEEYFNMDELNWHPVVNQRFWTMKLDDFKVGGVSTGFC